MTLCVGVLTGSSGGTVEAATEITVNAGAGVIAADSVTTAVADGRLCLTSSSRSQTTFDVSGWWLPA